MRKAWLALGLLCASMMALAIEPAHVQSTLMVAPTSTLQGVSGTATAITYTISGVELQGSIETPKQLAQGQLPASAGVLYTAPAGVTAFVSTIALVNTTGSAVSGVKVFVGGTAASNQVLNSLTIPANGQALYNGSGWTVTDANGAIQTASTGGGGTSYFAGTGLNLTGTTFNISTPISPSIGGIGQTSLGAVSLSAFGAPTGSVSWGSQKITSLLDPTNPQDASTKAYVDSVAQGLAVKDSVDYATTTTLPTYVYNNGASGVGATITEVGNGALPTIDGVSPTINDDFLVKNEISTNAPFNGIYVITQLGSVGTPFILTRRSDADSPTDLADSFCFVEAGTTNANGGFVLPLNASAITVGTTNLNFVQFSGAGEITAGAGMTKTGNTLNVGQNADNSVIVNTDDVQRAAITGDVGIPLGSNTSALGNIPNATTAAGSIIHSNIAAPSTPASGKDAIYSDSTDLRIHDKNASGVIGTTVVADTGATNNFLTAISTAGAISKAQPAFTNLSGSLACSQTPALTGNVTTSAGSCATTVASAPTTALTGTLQAAQFPALTGAITTTAGSLATTASAIPTTALTGTLQAAQFPALTGDTQTTAGSLATTTKAINGTPLSGLATGILKNTTTTGIPSIAVAGTDYAAPNSNTTGSAGSLSPGNTINGVNFTGSAPITVAAAAGTLTGSTLASGVTASSLTSVGTLGTLTVTAPIAGSVTGNAATVTTNANLTGPVTSSGNATTITPTITGAGPIGSTSQVPQITYNAAGQLTLVTPVTITPAAIGAVSSVSGTAPIVSSGGLTPAISITGASVTAAGSQSSAQFAKVANGYYDAAADFGMVGDQRVVFDGACSTGANTKVTSATAAFVSGDLGHRITLAGGGASGAVLDGTISNIDSGTQVTISGTTCATTVSAKGLQLGTSNATACASMISVINSLSYGAAIIHFPLSSTGRWACPTKLIFTRPATLEGQGSATNQDAGDYSKVLGTALAWWGTDNDGGVAFDAFIEFQPVAPIASQNQSFPAPGIRHLSIDCRNGDQSNCYAAVKLTDVVGFAIDDVFIMDPMVCFQMGTVDLTGVTAATGRGVMQNVGCRVLENTTAPVATAAATLTPTTIAAGSNNLVLTTSGQSISIAAANGIATPGYVVLMTDSGYRIPVKCTGGGGTTTLTGCVADADAASDSPKLVTGANIVQMTPNNGSCLLMGGTTNTNTNLFSLDMGRFSIGANWGMGCIEAHNADSISFRQVVINGGNATNGGAINRIQHPGVVVSGSNAAAANASRNITFWDGDAGTGGAESLGLTSAGAKLTAPAGPNYWTMYQLGNNNQAPTIENGSAFEWTANGGCQHGLRSYDQTAAVAYTAGTAKTIPGTAFQLGLQCIQTGVVFHWRYQLQKTTAAGTTARLTNIRIGTTGTQADANVCQFSNATTAAIDNGIVNVYYSITVGGTTASATGVCSMMIESRQLTATAGGLISTLGTPVTVGTPTAFSAPSGAIWYASLSQTTGTSEVSTTSFGAGYVEKIGIQSPGP